MPQTRDNGIEVPINSDEYALTADLAKMADSINVITIVANAAARDALSTYEGRQVYRADTGQVETYMGAAWAGAAATDITVFGPGWTALTGGHKPRISRSGNIAFLVGGVQLGATGNVNNMLTVPAELRPSNPATMFVGAGVTSTGGTSFELALAGGVLSVPSGYVSGTIAAGTVLPVTCSWPLF